MANEFIARKGIISLDSIQVSGSITATGGITVSGSISSASFATSTATASSADNFFVRQNLTASSALFTGSITAQTLVVQTVTSSIVYSSGSNIFGNQLTDTQRFTGSVLMTGSLSLTGPINSTSTICSTGNTCFGGNTIITGCLGIGTNTPTRKLTIDGSGGFSAATGSAIRLNNTTSGRFALIDFDDSQNFNIWSSTDSGNIRFFLNSGAGTERMRIDYCGNVGIGYTPCVNYGPLQVKSPASSYTIDLVGRTSGLNGESQITFWNSGQTVVQGAIGNIARCMVFYAGGTEVMRMTCGGNLYIGTANDINTAANRTVLTVNGSSTAIINLATGGAQSAYWYHNGTDMLFVNGKNGAALFYTCDNERMRITSGGNVGIGTTDNTAAYRLNVAVNGGSAYIGVTNQSGAAGDRYLRIGFGSGATVASIQGTRVNVADDVNLALQPDGGNVGIGTISPQLNTNSGKFLTVQSSVGSGWLELATSTTTDGLGGALSFNNTNRTGTDKRIAQIAGVKDGANDTGAMSFVTWNAGTGVERMRISCNGAVYINSSSNQLANATPALGILAGTTCDAVNIKHVQNGNNSVNIWQTGTSAFGAIVFYKGNTQDERGNITVSTTGTSFNSVSDYRLKENVTLSSCGLDRLMQLKPSKFNWIQTGEEAEGFIAHELQEVFPYAVTGEKDGVYSSTGNIKPQSVDYGRITPLLVKAIQEQQCQICTQSIIIDQLKTCLGII